MVGVLIRRDQPLENANLADDADGHCIYRFLCGGPHNSVAVKQKANAHMVMLGKTECVMAMLHLPDEKKSQNVQKK